jgi:hypothetical protein
MHRHCTRRSSPCGRAVGAVIAAALLVPAVAVAEDAVVVNISGPLKGVLGQKVAYDVELINNAGRNLEKLRVVDVFDEGFHHVASKSPIEFQQTIDLPAGTKKWVKLEFELDGVGRQCHRVEILDQAGKFLGGATECCGVEPPPQPAAATTAPAVPPVLVPPPATVTAPASTVIAPALPAAAAQPRLELAGPTEAVAGTPGTYKATIRNLGTAPTPAGTVKISWDNGLAPLQASEGFSLVGSSFSWNLPAIPAGGFAERDLVLQAEAPATMYSDAPPINARINAELSLGAGIAAADQRTVAIRSTTPRPRPRSIADSGIRLALADLDDPVRVGDATTLVCTIVNAGPTPSGLLDVVIDLPRGARPAGNYRARIENGRVLFDPLEVPPGGQKMVEVSYIVSEPGRYTASAGATSGTLTGSLARECETEFLPR